MCKFNVILFLKCFFGLRISNAYFMNILRICFCPEIYIVLVFVYWMPFVPGCAINLDNLSPTICINELIRKHNREKKQNLPLLSYEKFLAFTYTKLETLLTQAEVDISSIINLYYSYWLHRYLSICMAVKCVHFINNLMI